MTDKFQNHATGLESPADTAFAVTPSDAVDLAQVSRALYVGVAGDISLITRAGNEVVFTNVQAGSILPVRASRINATGTTAQDLVGLA